ncbi:MAG: fused MFS/spermidine synthase [Xanthobacteraceae bacterium]
MPQFVFSLTLVISAALLFWIQLLTSKMILPVLGGSASVWNTCMMFFQIALLLGYLYAHVANRTRSGRFSIFLHPALLAMAALSLHLSMAGVPSPDPAVNPIPWLLETLLVMVGAPFVILAGTAPMLQALFAETGARSSHDPYFLYAASNLGSLGALVSYPTIIEPYLRVSDQSRFWTAGYIALIVLSAACAAMVSVRIKSSRQITQRPDDQESIPPTILTRLRWLILAFAPSSLLLGVTTHLTTDIAAVPLFWVAPLVLYLLSFVIAFQRLFVLPEKAVAFLQATFLVPVGILFLTSQDDNIILQFGLHLTAFFVTALLCHLELARLRPSARHLTAFYLFLSLGGALGGVFNALLAPIIFDDVIEYPLVLIVACLLRPGILPNWKTGWRSIGDFALPALMLGLLVFLDRYTDLNLQDWAKTGPLIIAIICAIAVFAWQPRSIRFSLGMAAMIAAGYLISNNDDVLQQTRNFYGVLKVLADDSPLEHALYNGTTLHGEQAQDSAHRLEPLSYYHPDGPLGQLFVRLGRASLTRRVAVVGLGSGTIACYERAGDHWTFFEINPVDIAIAENPALFTFLRDCPGQTDIVLGDARLSLMGQPNHSFGMIVLDAFNSDSIPIHLMTRDAMQLYLNKLEPDGLLVYHVSNQHLDLSPIVANIAASLKLAARRFNDTMSDEHSDDPFGRDSSDWIVIARNKDDLTAITHDEKWQALLPSPGKGIWTDDYSNLLSALVP